MRGEQWIRLHFRYQLPRSFVEQDDLARLVPDPVKAVSDNRSRIIKHVHCNVNHTIQATFCILIDQKVTALTFATPTPQTSKLFIGQNN